MYGEKFHEAYCMEKDMFYPEMCFMKLQKVPWNKVLRPAT